MSRRVFLLENPVPDSRPNKAALKREANATSFKPGVSGNPGGKPKGLAEMQELCRSHTVESIDAILKVMRSDTAQPAAIVAGANSILDRGWGKATQPIESGGLDRLVEVLEARRKRSGV